MGVHICGDVIHVNLSIMEWSLLHLKRRAAAGRAVASRNTSGSAKE